jgi:TetR/AcrR family transcriptional repressor of nem operon
VARLFGSIFTEPIGWLEEQFRVAGHDKDSRELAMHLFSAFQGMAAVAHGVNEPDLVLMEVRRLKNWINTL